MYSFNKIYLSDFLPLDEFSILLGGGIEKTLGKAIKVKTIEKSSKKTITYFTYYIDDCKVYERETCLDPERMDYARAKTCFWIIPKDKKHEQECMKDLISKILDIYPQFKQKK